MTNFSQFLKFIFHRTEVQTIILMCWTAGQVYFRIGSKVMTQKTNTSFNFVKNPNLCSVFLQFLLWCFFFYLCHNFWTNQGLDLLCSAPQNDHLNLRFVKDIRIVVKKKFKKQLKMVVKRTFISCKFWATPSRCVHQIKEQTNFFLNVEFIFAY